MGRDRGRQPCLTVVPPSVSSAPSPATGLGHLDAGVDVGPGARGYRLSAVVPGRPARARRSTSRSSTTTAASSSNARRVRAPARIRRPSCPRPCAVQARLPPQQFGSHHGAYVPDRPAFDVPDQVKAATYRVEAVAVPGGTLVTAVPLDPTNQTLASLIHVEVIVSIVVVLALLGTGPVDRPLRPSAAGGDDRDGAAPSPPAT